MSSSSSSSIGSLSTRSMPSLASEEVRVHSFIHTCYEGSYSNLLQLYESIPTPSATLPASSGINIPHYGVLPIRLLLDKMRNKLGEIDPSSYSVERRNLIRKICFKLIQLTSHKADPLSMLSFLRMCSFNQTAIGILRKGYPTVLPLDTVPRPDIITKIMDWNGGTLTPEETRSFRIVWTFTPPKVPKRRSSKVRVSRTPQTFIPDLILRDLINERERQVQSAITAQLAEAPAFRAFPPVLFPVITQFLHISDIENFP